MHATVDIYQQYIVYRKSWKNDEQEYQTHTHTHTHTQTHTSRTLLTQEKCHDVVA